MNSIVCNSSPIIALSRIDCLTLLPRLFQKIYIPEAVLQEVNFGRERSIAPQLENEVFERYKVKNKIIVDKLYGKLHYGEIEVIIAAKELDLSDVVLDDLAARKVAETFLLQPIGTVGLLLLAFLCRSLLVVLQFKKWKSIGANEYSFMIASGQRLMLQQIFF